MADKQVGIRYAGFPPRFVAYLVDNILAALTLGLYVFYMLYTLSKKGETVGKNIAGIKVIKEGRKRGLGLGTAVLREIIGRFVDSLVFGVGGLYFLIDKDKQALHDKVANTYVVHK